MASIKQKEIAKNAGVSEYMVTLLKQGKSKTRNIPLAVAWAKKVGGRPIDFISDDIRKFALENNPDLNKRIRKQKPRAQNR